MRQSELEPERARAGKEMHRISGRVREDDWGASNPSEEQCEAVRSSPRWRTNVYPPLGGINYRCLLLQSKSL
jgi:hypothetical protein